MHPTDDSDATSSLASAPVPPANPTGRAIRDPLWAGMWLFWLSLLALFLPFTAEDAWIVLRYAAHWAEGQGLVFNPGEQVLALTSPLHAVLACLLHSVLHAPLLPYKLLSGMWVGFCLWRLSGAVPDSGRRLWGLLVLGSSPIALWTVGGLETPLLIGLAALLARELYLDPEGSKPGAGLRTGIWAGLFWLGRLDAALLVFPMVLQRVVGRGSRASKLGMVLLTFLPTLLWLGMAWQVYGDPLPTSFYVKPPQRTLSSVGWNALETLAWGGLTGMLPVLLLLLGGGVSARAGWTRSVQGIHRHWGLWLGVLLVWLYGLSVARIHMMFSFRFAVPMMPVMALLLADGLARRWEKAREDGRAAGSGIPGNRWQTGWSVGGVLLALGQVLLAVWTLEVSVNGLSPLGEYRHLSARAYARDFLPILEAQAHAGQQHWEQQQRAQQQRAQQHQAQLGQARAPVVMTYAAGVLPYVWKDARVLEALVAWRHRCEFNWQMSADYIQVITPRMGPLTAQLLIPLEGLRVVASSVAIFDGEEESFLLLYHPNAHENPISSRVDLPCYFPDALRVPWKMRTSSQK